MVNNIRSNSRRILLSKDTLPSIHRIIHLTIHLIIHRINLMGRLLLATLRNSRHTVLPRKAILLSSLMGSLRKVILNNRTALLKGSTLLQVRHKALRQDSMALQDPMDLYLRRHLLRAMETSHFLQQT